MFLLAVCFVFFESRMLLLNYVATPLYIYSAVFVVPTRVANAKLLFIFGTALEQIAVRHRFVHSKILKKSKNAAFYCAAS